MLDWWVAGADAGACRSGVVLRLSQLRLYAVGGSYPANTSNDLFPVTADGVVTVAVEMRSSPKNSFRVSEKENPAAAVRVAVMVKSRAAIRRISPRQPVTVQG